MLLQCIALHKWLWYLNVDHLFQVYDGLVKGALEKAVSTLNVSELRVHIRKKFTNTQRGHGKQSSILCVSACYIPSRYITSMLSPLVCTFLQPSFGQRRGQEQVCMNNLRVRRVTVPLGTWLSQLERQKGALMLAVTTALIVSTTVLDRSCIVVKLDVVYSRSVHA